MTSNFIYEGSYFWVSHMLYAFVLIINSVARPTVTLTKELLLIGITSDGHLYYALMKIY